MSAHAAGRRVMVFSQGTGRLRRGTRTGGAPEPPDAREGQLLTTMRPSRARLAGTIGAALLRASLERKLAREEPFSQQDIVTQALTGWLAANGYPVADS